MDLNAALIAFLDGLDTIPNVTTIGLDFFSTMQNWPLPAITCDMEQIGIGSMSEDASSIGATGVTLPIVIHIPIDKADPKGRKHLSSILTILQQIIPIATTCFPNCAISFADMWATVVPFGRGEAFGCGFTLTVSTV